MARGEDRPAKPDTGRPAYHEAGEEWRDDKHVVLTFAGRRVDCGQARIRIVHPFWRDDAERQAYERAVREIRPWEHFFARRDWKPEDKGQREIGGKVWLGMAALCQEIATLAEGFQGGLAKMPRPMSRRERDERLAELCRQAAESGPKEKGGE